MYIPDFHCAISKIIECYCVNLAMNIQVNHGMNAVYTVSFAVTCNLSKWKMVKDKVSEVKWYITL